MHKFIEQSTIINLNSIMSIHIRTRKRLNILIQNIQNIKLRKMFFFMHSLKMREKKIDNKFCHNMSRRHKHFAKKKFVENVKRILIQQYTLYLFEKMHDEKT